MTTIEELGEKASELHERLSALELSIKLGYDFAARISALEAAVEANTRSLRLHAEDWRKQRAVYEAMFAWNNCGARATQIIKCKAAVSAALHEALK